MEGKKMPIEELIDYSEFPEPTKFVYPFGSSADNLDQFLANLLERRSAPGRSLVGDTKTVNKFNVYCCLSLLITFIS